MNTKHNARTPTAVALSALLLVVASGCSDSDSDDGPSVVAPPSTDGGDGNGPPPGDSMLGGDTGVVPMVIDRMGRPGVSTALIREDDDEDRYNAAGDPGMWVEQFEDEMQERITLIDSLDGIVGNALFDAESLTTLLIDDRLTIDTSQAACMAYLAVEINGVEGCGGRTLEADVIDDTLQHLVANDESRRVSDLADGDAKTDRLPNVWPFLAAPI